MTFKCPRCAQPFASLNNAAQHLQKSKGPDHRDVNDYASAEKEVADAHYGAANGDNSVVDPNPQAEAHGELQRIRSIRDDGDDDENDDGVTNGDETADWLTDDGADARRADGGDDGVEPREPPEPETTADDGSTCAECGADGRPVGELIGRWPDELPEPVEASRYDWFCPECTTASEDSAQVEVWNE